MAMALRDSPLRTEVENHDKRVDTVVVLKTLDTGSTFLDVQIWPYQKHVSRWEEEVEQKLIFTEENNIIENYTDAHFQLLADWFAHKKGEQIVGASIDDQRIHKNWASRIWPLFTPEKHGKVLFIRMYRKLFQKHVSLLRRDALEKEGCPKRLIHKSEECIGKKVALDVELLKQKIEWDAEITERIKEAINQSAEDRPEMFAGYEVINYEDLLECQGIPQHINKYLGFPRKSGCNSSVTYKDERAFLPLSDVVSNLPEIQAAFEGTDVYEETVSDVKMYRAFPWDAEISLE